MGSQVIQIFEERQQNIIKKGINKKKSSQKYYCIHETRTETGYYVKGTLREQKTKSKK